MFPTCGPLSIRAVDPSARRRGTGGLSLGVERRSALDDGIVRIGDAGISDQNGIVAHGDHLPVMALDGDQLGGRGRDGCPRCEVVDVADPGRPSGHPRAEVVA